MHGGDNGFRVSTKAAPFGGLFAPLRAAINKRTKATRRSVERRSHQVLRKRITVFQHHNARRRVRDVAFRANDPYSKPRKLSGFMPDVRVGAHLLLLSTETADRPDDLRPKSLDFVGAFLCLRTT